MKEIRFLAKQYASYLSWTGPDKMKGYWLHIIRKNLEIACALYRASRKPRPIEGPLP